MKRGIISLVSVNALAFLSYIKYSTFYSVDISPCYKACFHACTLIDSENGSDDVPT